MYIPYDAVTAEMEYRRERLGKSYRAGRRQRRIHASDITPSGHIDAVDAREKVATR